MVKLIGTHTCAAKWIIVWASSASEVQMGKVTP
jgi:hypothetical protein